jgi:hypothetical protein
MKEKLEAPKCICGHVKLEHRNLIGTCTANLSKPKSFSDRSTHYKRCGCWAFKLDLHPEVK